MLQRTFLSERAATNVHKISIAASFMIPLQVKISIIHLNNCEVNVERKKEKTGGAVKLRTANSKRRGKQTLKILIWMEWCHSS